MTTETWFNHLVTLAVVTSLHTEQTGQQRIPLYQPSTEPSHTWTIVTVMQWCCLWTSSLFLIQSYLGDRTRNRATWVSAAHCAPEYWTSSATDPRMSGLQHDSDNDSAYREEVQHLKHWNANNLELNTTKTKEMIMDFRRFKQNCALFINGEEVERVESFKIHQVHHQHLSSGGEGTAKTLLSQEGPSGQSHLTAADQHLPIHHWESPDLLGLNEIIN